MASTSTDPPSILDDLGEEITGIMTPISICMALTVFLVRVLNPEGSASSSSVYIASIAYDEKSTDSSGKKFGGALLNAIIFVGVVAGMTVILFLLFKFGCYKIIYAYMAFAVFNIFFFLTGALCIQLFKRWDWHIDAFSYCFLVYNFSITGTLGILFIPIPLLLKQSYLVWTGVIIAYIFTFIPEWTAWVLLCLMAVYDIAAVLMPGGPLKALVELAVDRQRELPALIYEARPVGRGYQRGYWARRGGEQVPGDSPGGSTAQPPRPLGEGSSPASSTAAIAAAAAGAGGVGGLSGGWAQDVYHTPIEPMGYV